MWLIYKISFPNGKSYVGLTKNLANRKTTHKRDMVKKVHRPLYHALNHFGWESVKFEVVHKGIETLESANYLEIQYIKQLSSHVSDNGYNCSWGGDGCNGTPVKEEHKLRLIEETKIRWKDPKYRARMVAATKNRVVTEETKELMSDSAKKKIARDGHSWQGRKHSQESKDKMSRSKKLKDYSHIFTGRRVTCAALNFTFFSQKECCKELGISKYLFNRAIKFPYRYPYGLAYLEIPACLDQESLTP